MVPLRDARRPALATLPYYIVVSSYNSAVVELLIIKTDLLYFVFDFTVDEGKKRLNPSRTSQRKVEKSCVIFLLCDPGWYVCKPYAQNKWEENTNTHRDLARKK